MIESLFLSIIIILTLLYITAHKKITSLEGIFLWMVCVFINHTVFSILSGNMKLLSIPDEPAKIIIFRISSLTVFPLLMLSYINFLAGSTSKYVKAVFFAISLALLILFEQLLITFNYVKYNNWSLLKSSFLEIIYLFIFPMFSTAFRKLMLKEVKKNAASPPKI